MGRWLKLLKQTYPRADGASKDTKHSNDSVSPTEPTKAYSVGFVASISGDTPKTISGHREIVRACSLAGLSLRDVEAGLSDDDLADIRDGIVTAEVLAEYGRLFKESGYFWKRDTSQKAPWDEETKKPPMPPAKAEKPSTSNAWPPRKQQARDHFINHVLQCDYCYGPRDRYCDIGSKWREFFYWM